MVPECLYREAAVERPEASVSCCACRIEAGAPGGDMRAPDVHPPCTAAAQQNSHGKGAAGGSEVFEGWLVFQVCDGLGYFG